MEYTELCKIYGELEKTTKRLEKTDILARALKDAKATDLEEFVCLIRGKAFPQWSEQKLGMSSKLIVKAISKASGIPVSEVMKQWKKTGDLGNVAEALIGEKKQKTLVSERLSVKKVFENIRKLPEFTGKGTVAKKIDLIAELLASAKPIEARFIVRTVLEELRIGVADGTLRDAISKAFDVPQSEIEHAYNILVDYAKVVRQARDGKINHVGLSVGSPLKCMLAIRVKNFDDAFEAVGKPAIFEYKLDGFRVQIHKDGDKITLFTRRLENVTKQFNEVIPIIKKYIKGKSFVLDSELVGYNPKTGAYLPFQYISQRIKRKYDIESMAKKFPVEINIFDILYYNGKEMLDIPQKERRKLLESIIESVPKKIVLTKKIVTDDKKIAEKFFKDALKSGNEGVMIKNINSKYVFGRHVGGWVKLKSMMETLDLVITGAQWGEGKRVSWLSSFTLACKSDSEFLEVGKVGTGIKEKSEEGVGFEELTKELKPYIIKQEEKRAAIKPRLVVEIVYEEIQKSPTYKSGYALRFPRVLRIRYDKSADDCDNFNRIKRLYKMQKRALKK